MHFEDQCVRRSRKTIVERYKTSLKWVTPEIKRAGGKKCKAFKRKMDIFSGKERKNRQSLQWNELLKVYKIFQSDNETYSRVISSNLWPPRRHSSKCLCHLLVKSLSDPLLCCLKFCQNEIRGGKQGKPKQHWHCLAEAHPTAAHNI